MHFSLFFMSLEWIGFTFIAITIWAALNVMDNYLSNKIVKSSLALLTLWGFFNLLASIAVFIAFRPNILEIESSILILLIAAGILYNLSILCYLKALKSEDTSHVIAYWNIGSLFVPIIAFIFLNERLRLNEYLAIPLILISSFIISIRDTKNLFKPSKGLFLMVFASLFIAFVSIVQKFILVKGIHFITLFILIFFFRSIISQILLINKKIREEHFKVLKQTKTVLIFLVGAILVIISSLAHLYALSIASVSLISVVESIQPLIVLLYAILFSRFFPKLFKEEIDKKSIAIKGIAFIVMIFGIYLLSI